MGMQQQQAVPLNPFHWHEALDRGFTCMKMIDQLLLQHPVVAQHEALQSKVNQARSLLLEACQQMAGLSMEGGDAK
jgi:cell fate (sporulation/competence/biofilm development) regulator YmcA (YheA/YmcA/DUF963 family)